jgi:DNA-binding beta-propeller fold protein YncE
MQRIRCLTSVTFIVFLIACGARDVPSQNPAPATSVSADSLVLPDIPAYPSAHTFSVQQRTAQQMSLDLTRVIGDVQVVTIQTTGEPLDQFRAVADFYRQTLPDLGWTLAADLGPATLYRRSTERTSQERGLYVTVRAGLSRHEVEVELATFLAPAPITAPTRTLTHRATWKHIDSDVTEAFGIVSGGADTLFVSDVRNARLLEISGTGSVRRSIKAESGPSGSATGDADRDANNFLGLVLDSSGRLLAIAGGGDRVLRFGPDRQQHVLIHDLTDAKSLAVAPNGNIYVSDSEHSGIRVFNADGVEIASWSIEMPDDAQAFASPAWIAVDRAGAVYVTDSTNNRVKKFDPTGKALNAWGSEGHSPGRFTSPAGIAIAPDGLIYVVDGNPNNRVQIFTPAGVLIGIWWPRANWWEPEDSAQIYAAEGIAVGDDGRISIADNGAGEIDILSTSDAPATSVPLPPGKDGPSQDVASSSGLRQVPTEHDWVAASRAWLNGKPCRVPCWEGITPGKTTVGEALVLLKQNPLIDPSSVAVLSARDVQGTDGFDPKYYPDVVVWGWVGASGSGTYGGTLYFNRHGSPPDDMSDSSIVGARIEPDDTLLTQVIYAIRVDFLSFRADPSVTDSLPIFPFTLADVQTALGQPTYILAIKGGADWYTQSLIYPQQGTILLESGASVPRLADTWKPRVLILSDQPLVDGRFGHDAAFLTQWQGLQPFAFYCRDEHGAACQPAQSH